MRGNVAKETVTKKIAETFGESYLGLDDKGRMMLLVNDGGEMVNICLAMTCPKVTVKPTETATTNDEVTIEDLMKRLGI